MITDPLTEYEMKQIEARWKSDVDFKLDALLEYNEKNAALLTLLTTREQRRVKVQQAIIDKSLTALIWAGVVGLGTLVWSGVKTEWHDTIEAMKSLRK